MKSRRIVKPWLMVLLLGLALFLTHPVWALSIPNADVEIPMPDGAVVVGRLFDPSQKPETDDAEEAAPADEEGAEPAPPSVRYPLVILLHGLSGTNSDWDIIIPKLVKQGYAVFAQDLRGHGGSTKKGKGRKTWRVYEKEDWQQMPRDVERVVRYFQAGEGKDEYPQVNANAVGLVGTKLGANVALLGAARLSQLKTPVKVLILMAPSLDYKGLQTSMPIVNYKGPLLMMASQTDPVSFEQTQILYRWALGARSIRLYKNIGDSTDMLRRQPDTQTHLINWLVKYLPPTPPAGKKP